MELPGIHSRQDKDRHNRNHEGQKSSLRHLHPPAAVRLISPFSVPPTASPEGYSRGRRKPLRAGMCFDPPGADVQKTRGIGMESGGWIVGLT